MLNLRQTNSQVLSRVDIESLVIAARYERDAAFAEMISSGFQRLRAFVVLCARRAVDFANSHHGHGHA